MSNRVTIKAQQSALERGRKPMVLAVEDDRTMLMALVDIRERLDNDVVTAKNGREALDIVVQRKGEIGAILLDREMPIMDGMTMLKQIRKDSTLRRIPVIMQTGSDSAKQIREGIDAGVFYYLTKPINEGVLRSVLAEAVRESQDDLFRVQEIPGDQQNDVDYKQIFLSHFIARSRKA